MRAKYILSEVAVGLWRNVTMTIAMIITMTVSLTMLGASLLLFAQVDQMKDYYYSKVQVSIFLADDITDDPRQQLGDQLRADPLVKSVIYESKDEAYRRFSTNFADEPDLVNSTKPESLPESYRVSLNDVTQFQQIYDKYKNTPGIGEIVDQRKLLAKIFNIMNSI